jgi:hypothetical protein
MSIESSPSLWAKTPEAVNKDISSINIMFYMHSIITNNMNKKINTYKTGLIYAVISRINSNIQRIRIESPSDNYRTKNSRVVFL